MALRWLRTGGGVMLYPFRSGAGQEIELDYPMDEAPPVGYQVVVNGVPYTRQLAMPIVRVPRDEAFESISAPSRENAKLWGLPAPPEGYSEDGSARFGGRRQAREWGKRCEREDGEIVFDD